jgi:hypothetical protein
MNNAVQREALLSAAARKHGDKARTAGASRERVLSDTIADLNTAVVTTASAPGRTS